MQRILIILAGLSISIDLLSRAVAAAANHGIGTSALFFALLLAYAVYLRWRLKHHAERPENCTGTSSQQGS